MTSFRAATEEGMKPDLVWRLVVGIMSLFAIGIGVFGYITYVWAGNTQAPTVTLKEDQAGFSLGDLDSVLHSYEEKEANLKILKTERPVAPPHQLGEGAAIASTPSVSDENTLLPPESSASAGIMPQ